MQTAFQLASVHGMLYTGGNVVFSPDGALLYSPVHNHISAIQLQQEGHQTFTCSNSTLQCFDLSPDGDLLIAIGDRGLGFFYSLSARVVLDTIAFPPQCQIAMVRFSPCGRYVAVALETTLQVYTAPAKRVVSFHGCHRVENLHSILSLPIHHIDWTGDSEHLLLAGQDARMRIVPRQLKPHLKRAAFQHNALIGHRGAVLGAWFVAASAREAEAATTTEKGKDDDEEEDASTARVISVGVDNVVLVWRRGQVPRREVLQAIAQARVNARCAVPGANEDGGDNDEDDDEAVPLSFLEKQRVAELRARGMRTSIANDSHLPPILRNAYETAQKFMLTHKGALTVTAYHKPRGLLALGYDSGIFAIHTLSAENELTLVHLLSISAQALTAACFSPRGNFVAFGSAHLKQLLVWDWQAEAYVLKEQAHYYDIARTAITADGGSIISGGDDGKVKVWKVASGQCYVTFTEHQGPITGIATSAATNAFFTCSMDGTARGYDLLRYRAFRLFTPPEETQLACLAVDPAGEVLAVGSARQNTIYLFAVQTGRVIDALHGHEAPIACLAFHPAGTTLTSGSIDHNLVFWDLFAQNEGGARLKGEAEVLDVGTEVLAVAYSSGGRRMAVLTAKQEVSVYETVVPAEPELLKTFAVGHDAAGGWQKEVGPRSANYDAHFTRLAFSPEGEKLLLGGDSKWLVLYHATQGYVLRKWPVTVNLDVQGAEEQYPWRSVTEAGMLEDIDVSAEDIHLTRRKLLEMPGSRHRHFATGKRKTALVARTMDLAFAPTGSEFVAATTDGLLVFSLHVARPRFQPLQLTAAVTTAQVQAQLREGQPVLALVGALLLGDEMLGVACLRQMPREAIPVAVSATPTAVYALLVRWVAAEVTRSRGIEHALLWAQSLLLHSPEAAHAHAAYTRGQSDAHILPALKTLLRSLYQHQLLSQLSRENYFSLRYLADVARMNAHPLRALEDTAEQTTTTTTE